MSDDLGDLFVRACGALVAAVFLTWVKVVIIVASLKWLEVLP